jgi:hypothetical protein
VDARDEPAALVARQSSEDRGALFTALNIENENSILPKTKRSTSELDKDWIDIRATPAGQIDHHATLTGLPPDLSVEIDVRPHFFAQLTKMI